VDQPVAVRADRFEIRWIVVLVIQVLVVNVKLRGMFCDEPAPLAGRLLERRVGTPGTAPLAGSLFPVGSIAAPASTASLADRDQAAGFALCRATHCIHIAQAVNGPAQAPDGITAGGLLTCPLSASPHRAPHDAPAGRRRPAPHGVPSRASLIERMSIRIASPVSSAASRSGDTSHVFSRVTGR